MRKLSLSLLSSALAFSYSALAYTPAEGIYVAVGAAREMHRLQGLDIASQNLRLDLVNDEWVYQAMVGYGIVDSDWYLGVEGHAYLSETELQWLQQIRGSDVIPGLSETIKNRFAIKAVLGQFMSSGVMPYVSGGWAYNKFVSLMPNSAERTRNEGIAAALQDQQSGFELGLGIRIYRGNQWFIQGGYQMTYYGKPFWAEDSKTTTTVVKDDNLKRQTSAIQVGIGYIF